MSDFIREIEIINYKCFNNFKADGFKRVNLIGGKNNIGKTSFMEACLICSADLPENIYDKLYDFDKDIVELNKLKEFLEEFKD